jgi:hypothetical protein
MSEYNYSYDLPARIRNMETWVALLVKEKSIREEFILRLKNEHPDSIELIEEEKKVVELSQEILSKNEFIAKLREKSKVDDKEFRKNAAEALARYNVIIKEAGEFLDIDEQENDGFSWNGNIVNYQQNCLVLVKNEKADAKDKEGRIVYWYNALKKSLSQAKKFREQQKQKEADGPVLKVNQEAENPELSE